jgi:hypothetical protein
LQNSCFLHNAEGQLWIESGHPVKPPEQRGRAKSQLSQPLSWSRQNADKPTLSA